MQAYETQKYKVGDYVTWVDKGGPLKCFSGQIGRVIGFTWTKHAWAEKFMCVYTIDHVTQFPWYTPTSEWREDMIQPCSVKDLKLENVSFMSLARCINDLPIHKNKRIKIADALAPVLAEIMPDWDEFAWREQAIQKDHKYPIQSLEPKKS